MNNQAGAEVVYEDVLHKLERAELLAEDESHKRERDERGFNGTNLSKGALRNGSGATGTDLFSIAPDRHLHRL